MAQAPETGTTSTSGQSKTSSFLEKAKAKANVAAAKAKELGDKAVAATKKFADETHEDYTNSKTMIGLTKMAITDFQTYIWTRSKTTDRNPEIQKIADSFKDAQGICFVVAMNLALTVGGSYGRGIVMKRLEDGTWSLPLAIQNVEANVGWQLNVSKTKNFYVLRNESAINNFLQKGNVEVGGAGFAAVGKYGLEAQAQARASKDSLTTTTNDAKDVAATNTGVGSIQGVALGAKVSLGTYQSCKKINEATYDNFNIKTLFDNGVNYNNESNGVDGTVPAVDNGANAAVDNAAAPADDEKADDNGNGNVNILKLSDEDKVELYKNLNEFTRMIDEVIKIDQSVAADAAATSASAAQ